jgi:hypothetical protein
MTLYIKQDGNTTTVIEIARTVITEPNQIPQVSMPIDSSLAQNPTPNAVIPPNNLDPEE